MFKSRKASRAGLEGGIVYNPSEDKFRRRMALRGELKVFVSHRWDYDAHIHERLSSFNAREAGIKVVDHSLSADEKLTGPRGGNIPRALIYDEVTKRMAECDLIAAPSKVPRAQKDVDWVRRELETALIMLKKPVLFVDHFDQQLMHTSLLDELRQVNERLVFHAKADDRSLIQEINKIVAFICSQDNAGE